MLILGGAGDTALCCPGGERRRGGGRCRARAAGPALPPSGNSARGGPAATAPTRPNPTGRAGSAAAPRHRAGRGATGSQFWFLG